MGNRKAPTPPPTNQRKPAPPPAPPRKRADYLAYDRTTIDVRENRKPEPPRFGGFVQCMDPHCHLMREHSPEECGGHQPPEPPPAREDSGRKIHEGPTFRRGSRFVEPPLPPMRDERGRPWPPSPFPPNRTIAEPGLGPVAYIFGGLVAGAVLVVVLQAVGFWPWP